jgi:hypothetical protein
MTANGNMHSPKVITIRQTQTCCPGHVFMHSSTPINETVRSSQKSLHIYQTARRHIPDDGYLRSHTRQTSSLAYCVSFDWIIYIFRLPGTIALNIWTMHFCFAHQHNLQIAERRYRSHRSRAINSTMPAGSNEATHVPYQATAIRNIIVLAVKNWTYFLPPTLAKTRETLWRSMVT